MFPVIYQPISTQHWFGNYLSSSTESSFDVPVTLSGDRCFASAGPRLWNRLPPHLRQCDSLADSLNGCSILICLVLETAALCGISVRSAVYKSSYLLTYGAGHSWERQYPWDRLHGDGDDFVITLTWLDFPLVCVIC